MLASGSFPSVRAADLPAGVDHQRADPALVSFVVSFGYVRNRSECPTEDGQPRSRTVATYAVPAAQTWKACWQLPVNVRGRSLAVRLRRLAGRS